MNVVRSVYVDNVGNERNYKLRDGWVVSLILVVFGEFKGINYLSSQNFLVCFYLYVIIKFRDDVYWLKFNIQ